ncbi:salicylate hydroxylase [Cordyceps javanica]|nr:salicylate hydroxylase [Cordyceps javanica]
MKVVISGAGLGGLACAVACKKEGISVHILERTKKLSEVGAGIQIPPNGSKVACRLGYFEALTEHGIMLDHLDYCRYSSGNILLRRDQDWLQKSFGSPWMVIHRADYHKVLWGRSKELGVELSLGAETVHVDFNTTEVILKSNEKISADVIIGADGLWSMTRDSILECRSPPTATGDLAYRVTISAEQIESLNDASVSELCSQSGVKTWLGPRSHCVFYPLKHGSEFNIVLLVPDNLEHGVKRAEGDVDEMRALFEGWDERLSKMLSLVKSVEKWKLCHHEELACWSKNSVTVLGDACHPTLPYQAQGAAMAVEDGAVLGRLLGLLKTSTKDASTLQERIPGVLKLYEEL